MKADLHIHTTRSDGSKSPTEVVRWAKEKGLEVMAITDHDSVAGLEEGREEARKLGIKFVDGIEFSTYSICEIHVLGYNIDYKNPDFVQELACVKDMRRQRNQQIGTKLKALGIDLDIDFSGDGLGRMNMARAMVAKGFCNDVNEAFEKYLGPSGKAYCDTKRLTPAGAVQLIKKYGGFASVAHPKKYLLDKRLDLLLDGLKSLDLTGSNSTIRPTTRRIWQSLRRLQKRTVFCPTGGSDYHGDEDKNFVYELDARTARRLGVM